MAKDSELDRVDLRVLVERRSSG